MAQHRWATSPPSRGRISAWQNPPDPVQDVDGPEDLETPENVVTLDNVETLDGPRPPPRGGRRWAVGRGASLVVLGLTLSIAFGLFVLRGAPSPEVTSVAFDAPASSQPGTGGASGSSGAPSSGAPSSGVPPQGERVGSGSTGGLSPPAPSQGTADTAEDAVQQVLLVHVAGAVARPGVVELASGSRAFEALDLAGGALPEADLAAINLAAPVQDGQQIRVPLHGEVPPNGLPPLGSGDSGGAGGGPAAGGPEAPPPVGPMGSPGMVNINTADLDELETLPRIGPVLAERILQWRTDHGGFTRPEDLDAVPGIGEAMLAALLPVVTV
ncbi:helix-hairpin-helix domain-containing protein [Arthrobacter sp. Hz1]